MSDDVPDVPEERPFPLDFGSLFASAFNPGPSSGPVNWPVAEQLAGALAGVDPDTNEPRPDPPVGSDAAGTMRGLVQAAQSYVAGATGIATTLTVPIHVVTRHEWTNITMTGLRPVLESLATSVVPNPDPTNSPTDGDPFGMPGPDDVAMTEMLRNLAPTLFAVQAGTMAGMLSQYALGQYDLPLPLAGEPALAFIPANVDSFAADWGLPIDDLRFALALREVVHAAQRSIPWVRDRLLSLAMRFVSGYELRPEALEAQFGNFDISKLDLSGLDLSKFDPATFDPATFDPATFDPESLGLGNIDFSALDDQMAALGNTDPSKLLEGMRTPAQAPILAELQRFGAVLAGYADIVVETVGGPLITDLGRIDEALRRHRVERGRIAEFVDQMLGLALDREHYDAGAAFCRGVTERAGLGGLNRLWESEEMAPTPSEFAAPGLWLARISL